MYKIKNATSVSGIIAGLMIATVTCYATSNSYTMKKTESRTSSHQENGVH